MTVEEKKRKVRYYQHVGRAFGTQLGTKFIQNIHNI